MGLGKTKPVKTVNICINPEILQDFDAKISPIHRSTALTILIQRFIKNDESLSDFLSNGSNGSRMNHQRGIKD